MDPHSPDPLIASFESTENTLSDSFRAAALKVTNLYRESAYIAGNSTAGLDSNVDNNVHDSYKAAAHKVTLLYKDALVQNRKAYTAGYQQALQDLYGFISSHPRTAITQHAGSSSSFPVEHGYLPVQDVLGFARHRNAQLTSDAIHVETELQMQLPSSDTAHSDPLMATASGKDTLTSPTAQYAMNHQDFSEMTHPSTPEFMEHAPTGHLSVMKTNSLQMLEMAPDQQLLSSYPRDISPKQTTLTTNINSPAIWDANVYQGNGNGSGNGNGNGNDHLKRRYNSDAWVDQQHLSKKGRR